MLKRLQFQNDTELKGRTCHFSCTFTPSEPSTVQTLYTTFLAPLGFVTLKDHKIMTRIESIIGIWHTIRKKKKESAI